MNTAMHPALAIDYARARAVETAHHAEQARRAKAFRSDPVRRSPRRRRRFAWSAFGLRPAHGR
jgi:hypothetical protein